LNVHSLGALYEAFEPALAVPLEQLEPISGDPKAIEIIEDWLYWCLMGYEF